MNIPNNQSIVEELGLQNLPQQEQDQVTQTIINHLQDLLINTFVLELGQKQREQFLQSLNTESFDEDLMSKLAIQVPGLNQKLQSTIEAEWDIIKTAYNQTKK
ncbi:MAG: hypothetical protein R3B41_01675 [Candidatus Doudnabacteria bacterium]